jgi:uncharacterized membrane protein
MLPVLVPLLAAVIYAAATFFVRSALRRGINVAFQYGVTNVVMAVVVGGGAFVLAGGRLILDSPWPFVTAVLFLVGQLLIVAALRTGDSSIQTPLMGLKVLFVPVVVALGFGEAVELQIWAAAALSTVAVFLIGFRRDQGGAFHALPVLATVASTIFFAGSDVIIAELSGELGNAEFMASLLMTVGLLSVPIGIVGGIAQRRGGGLAGGRAPRPAPPSRTAVRALLLGSLFMALQFAMFATVLSVFSEAPRSNVLYSTRGLWSVALLFVLNRAGHGHHMEHAPQAVIVRRFVGAALLVVAVLFAV